MAESPLFLSGRPFQSGFGVVVLFAFGATFAPGLRPRPIFSAIARRVAE